MGLYIKPVWYTGSYRMSEEEIKVINEWMKVTQYKKEIWLVK